MYGGEAEAAHPEDAEAARSGERGGGRWEEEGRYISERRTIFDWVNVKARKKNKNVTNFSMPASLN